MNRVVMLLATVGFCGSVAGGGPSFTLTDEDGQESKRFCFGQDDPVSIGTNVYTIGSIRSAHEGLSHRLRDIRIPKLELKDAAVKEVIAFLGKVAPKAGHQQTPVNIVCDGIDESKTVSLALRDVSLVDALRAVCRLAGLQYRLQDGVVWITTVPEARGRIVRRVYDVLPSIRERAALALENAGDDHGDPFLNDEVDAEDDKAIRQLLEQFGVPWPAGSTMRFIPSMGQLFVANETEALDTIERLLGSLGCLPTMIEVETQFVAFDVEQMAKAKGPVAADYVMGLWTNGQGRLLAAPRALTLSGCEATVKGVTEYIYPTEFTVQPLRSGGGLSAADRTGISNESSVVGAVVEPSCFETREVGTVLMVLPEVSPEGDLLHVTLSPERVGEPTWECYDLLATVGTGVAKGKAKQPLFETATYSTSVMVRSGVPLLMGGGAPTRDGKHVVYMFLTATRVDTKGQPVPTLGDGFTW